MAFGIEVLEQGVAGQFLAAPDQAGEPSIVEPHFMARAGLAT
jgi:hypothetical protein